MKNLRRSWKVAALFALGALVAVLYIVHPGSIARHAQAQPNAEPTSTLVFPYVNTTTGYDTVIGIVNTSSEAGICTVTLVATGPSVTVPTPTITTFTIPPAGLSTIDAAGYTPFAGNYGYAIATCDFLNAYGYAEQMDTTSHTSWAVMSAYIAREVGRQIQR